MRKPFLFKLLNSSPRWHTLNTFTAMTHLYLFLFLVELFHFLFMHSHRKMPQSFSWLFTYFSSPLPVQIEWYENLFFICFISTRFEDEREREKYYSKRLPIFHPIYDDKKFPLILFIWSQEMCYEIFLLFSCTKARYKD